MKPLVQVNRKGRNNPKKIVLITINIGEGFLIEATVLSNLRGEISAIADYVINNLKEEEETWL